MLRGTQPVTFSPPACGHVTLSLPALRRVCRRRVTSPRPPVPRPQCARPLQGCSPLCPSPQLPWTSPGSDLAFHARPEILSRVGRGRAIFAPGFCRCPAHRQCLGNKYTGDVTPVGDVRAAPRCGVHRPRPARCCPHGPRASRPGGTSAPPRHRPGPKGLPGPWLPGPHAPRNRKLPRADLCLSVSPRSCDPKRQTNLTCFAFVLFL